MGDLSCPKKGMSTTFYGTRTLIIVWVIPDSDLTLNFLAPKSYSIFGSSPFQSTVHTTMFENCTKCRTTNLCLIKSDLSGNTVWPQASGFQKLAKTGQLLSTQNVNVARFARNVECDFFGDFQTLWTCVMLWSMEKKVKQSRFLLPSPQIKNWFSLPSPYIMTTPCNATQPTTKCPKIQSIQLPTFVFLCKEFSFIFH